MDEYNKFLLELNSKPPEDYTPYGRLIFNINTHKGILESFFQFGEEIKEFQLKEDKNGISNSLRTSKDV